MEVARTHVVLVGVVLLAASVYVREPFTPAVLRQLFRLIALIQAPFRYFVEAAVILFGQQLLSLALGVAVAANNHTVYHRASTTSTARSESCRVRIEGPWLL